MDTKEAIKLAKNYVTEMFLDEGISNLGLEEVSFNDKDKLWNITLGFSRTWQKNNAATSLGLSAMRSYKIIKISDVDGSIISINKDGPFA